MAVGDVITFTTIEGQSTIGGEEGTHYTATVVITDDLEWLRHRAHNRHGHWAYHPLCQSDPDQICPARNWTRADHDLYHPGV